MNHLNEQEKIGYALAALERWLEEYANREGLQVEKLKARAGAFLMPNSLVRLPIKTAKKSVSKQVQDYWQKMTPEQRKAEMQRRREISISLTPEQKKQRSNELKRKRQNKFPMGGIA